MPDLATCSYTGFTPAMGVPVRISIGVPRFRLSYHKAGSGWVTIPELYPRPEYVQMPRDERDTFRRRYQADLKGRTEAIRRRLDDTSRDYEGRLVLLCFEKAVTGVLDCHRRMFAEFWELLTGDEVPEIGNGR